VGKIILVVGGPGAGKSTACRLVAQRFNRSVYHEADRVREDVVRGFAPPQLPYSPDNLKQFTLGRTVSTFMAQAYCDAGFTVVVDDTFACHVDDGYRDLLADHNTVGIFLGPSKQTLINRMTARQGAIDHMLIELVEHGYDQVIAEVDLSRWHVIDNSDLGVEETVQRIVDAAEATPNRSRRSDRA
jgi:predicted kinase